jgi:hypothetical protein
MTETTSAPTYEYVDDVARGVALLDAYTPGWRADVDVDTLDMADVRRCVLGQSFGVDGYNSVIGDDKLGWNQLLSRLGAPVGQLDDDNYSLRTQWCEWRGFEARFADYSSGRNYDGLTATWHAYLRGELSLPPLDHVNDADVAAELDADTSATEPS